MSAEAELLLRRCDQLAACTEEPGRITRPFATDSMRRANELVAGWMRAAGMAVRRDSVGNLLGRYEAAPGMPTLLLGSHLDSVRDAGRYDGPLGVLAAVAVVERLHAAGRRLPFALEVLAFADEEGLRFGTSYLGSAALAGSFAPALLARVDGSAPSVGTRRASQRSGATPPGCWGTSSCISSRGRCWRPSGCRLAW
jgi:allantoate deiminase